MKNILYLLMTLTTFSCTDYFGEEGTGEPPIDYDKLDKAALWESELLWVENPNVHLQPPPLYLEVIPIYEDVIMAGYSSYEDKRLFIGLNIHTGKRVWTGTYKTWRRFIVSKSYQFQKEKYYYFYATEKNEIEGEEREPFFQFDITTGALTSRTVFDEVSAGYPYILTHLENTIVSLEPGWIDPETGIKEKRFWIHSTDNITHREALIPPRLYTANRRSGAASVSDFKLAKEAASGDIILIYKMREADYDDNIHEYKDLIYHINAYNITQKKWVYKHLLTAAGGLRSTEVFGDLIFYAGGGPPNEYPKKGPLPGLWAHNWKTGKQVWETLATALDPNTDLSFSPTGIGVYQGTIVFSSIDYAYGIDAKTGKMKWKVRGIGNTGSKFVFHNGVAYATSSDGFLYGWDVETGELLLRARCPSEGRTLYGRKVLGFWSNIGLYIDKNGKAILVAGNAYYMYAFEAVR